MEMESILASVKKMLGIGSDYDHFDPEIIMHINSTFSDLHRLGVGPREGFVIEDDTSTWADIMPDMIGVHSIKTYIFLKVKLLFDNSTLSSTVIAAMERQIKEYEWSLNAVCDFSREEES